MPNANTATAATPAVEETTPLVVTFNENNTMALATTKIGRNKVVIVVPNIWNFPDKEMFGTAAREEADKAIELLTARTPKTGRIKGTHPIKDIARKVGSMRELASILGVTSQTVNRWSKDGAVIHQRLVREKLIEMARGLFPIERANEIAAFYA